MPSTTTTEEEKRTIVLVIVVRGTADVSRPDSTGRVLKPREGEVLGSTIHSVAPDPVEPVPKTSP